MHTPLSIPICRECFGTNKTAQTLLMPVPIWQLREFLFSRNKLDRGTLSTVSNETAYSAWLEGLKDLEVDIIGIRLLLPVSSVGPEVDIVGTGLLLDIVGILEVCLFGVSTYMCLLTLSLPIFLENKPLNAS